MCNLLAINLTHRIMSDVNILDGKFHLKKGTIIIPQISCVLYDEKVVENNKILILFFKIDFPKSNAFRAGTIFG